MRPVPVVIAALLLAGCGSDDGTPGVEPTARVTRLEQLRAPCEAEVRTVDTAVEAYYALEQEYPGGVADLVRAGLVRAGQLVFVAAIDRRTGALRLIEGAPCSVR